jgi:carboxyl-terminal processing protease
LYFSFANRYAAQHASIPQPAEFKLTDRDFDDFIAFIKEKKFTYTPQTKEYFDELYNFSKLEGLDKEAEAEFEALRSKLLPDLDVKLHENKDEILNLLGIEIIKRYYYQKGAIEYSLIDDKDLKVAVELLNDQAKFLALLQKGIE